MKKLLTTYSRKEKNRLNSDKVKGNHNHKVLGQWQSLLIGIKL